MNFEKNKFKDRAKLGLFLAALGAVSAGEYIHAHKQSTSKVPMEAQRILKNDLQPTAANLGARLLNYLHEDNGAVIQKDPAVKNGVTVHIDLVGADVVYQMDVKMLQRGDTLEPSTTYEALVVKNIPAINYGMDGLIGRGSDPMLHDSNVWYGTVNDGSDIATGQHINTHVGRSIKPHQLHERAAAVAGDTSRLANEMFEHFAPPS